jgi:hypothetical protein
VEAKLVAAPNTPKRLLLHAPSFCGNAASKS